MGELSIIWLSEECSGAKIALVSTHISLIHGLCEYSLFYERRALEGEWMKAWGRERARSRQGERVNG